MIPAADNAAETPRQKIHSNNFNFLRVVFAFLVIWSHSAELADGNRSREPLTYLFHTIALGAFAVNCFFILSGYLIIKSWQSRPVVSDYMRKRVLRIVPGFLVAYFVSIFVVGPMGAASLASYFSGVGWKTVLANAAVLTTPPYIATTFSGLHLRFVNGSLWTIQYEFGCYLLVVALGLLGILRNRRAFVLCFLLAAGSYCFMSYFNLDKSAPLLGSSMQWSRLVTFFLTGGGFYLYRDRLAYRPQWAALAFAALIAALFLSKIQALVLPLSQAYLLFFIGFYPAPALAKIGTNADLSYGIYLYAWPVQTLLLWYFRGMNPWLLCVVAFVITSGLAWLSWNFIEKPALSLKPRSRVSPGK